MSELLRAAPRPFFALAFVALVVLCLAATRDYAVPIAIAVLIWFLINALSGALRRTAVIGPWLPGWLAKTLAVCVLFGLMALAGQVVVSNVGDLSRGVTGEKEVVLAKLESLARGLGFETTLTAEEVFDRLQFDRILAFTLDAVRGLLADFALVFLYVMFLLVDERFYAAKLRALIPEEGPRDRLNAALARIASEVRIYLWLMTVISLGVALSTYVACAAAGVSGAGFWAFVAFLLNFIPTIGSITAVVLPCVYALLTLEDPVAVFALIGALSATQFVAGEVVLPRVMGDRLNLSSAVILLTLVVWGAIWGPAGMFLAIPITVILVLICARFEATRPIAVVLSKDGRVPRI